MNYEDAGVNIRAGEQAVLDIKQLAKSTYTPNVLGELGSFGGLFRFPAEQYSQPILVSSTDGVGTKLRVALMAEVFDTVGQDLVNHCVNDILVQGAEPMFFLDYIGMGHMDPVMVKQVISGMAKACRENGCALIGGEMAEMPGIYHGRDIDLVGTIVGVVDQANLLPANRIQAGDILVGLPSSGLHTNGYSLARKIVFEKLGLNVDSYVPECGATVAELLLSIHRSYLAQLRPYLRMPGMHGLAHITGGGIPGNLRRVLPEGMSAYVSYSAKEYPALFTWLQNAGGMDDDAARQAFNLGIGMIAVLTEDCVESFVRETGGLVIGEIGITREFEDKVVFV